MSHKPFLAPAIDRAAHAARLSWTALCRAKVVRCCAPGCAAQLVLHNQVPVDPVRATSHQQAAELEHRAIAGAGWMVTSGVTICPAHLDTIGDELTDEARRTLAKERRTLLAMVVERSEKR